NSDLANGLGNLASRTLSMIHQCRGGAVPASGGDSHIAAGATEVTAQALEAYERFEFSKALEAIWGLFGRGDKFIVERAPWKLAKSGEESRQLLDDTLYTAAETLRIVTALLWPVIPDAAGRIWSQLGFREPISEIRTKDLHWGHLKSGQMLGAVSGVFP